MADGLKDRAERARIVRELDRNLMVHAGAGAGKTYELVERMAAQIVWGGAPVEQMAAITFTRKAAGEMRDRFFRRLREKKEEVHTDSDLGPLFSTSDESRIKNALARIDQCFIGTIHSFCARILKERPIEAGLPPDFTEIDEHEEIHLMRAAWDQYLQRCFTQDDPLLRELKTLGVDPRSLTEFFFRLYTFPDLPLAPHEAPEPRLQKAAETAADFVEHLQGMLPEDYDGQTDRLMQSILRASRFIRHYGISSDANRATLLSILKPARAVQTHWAFAGKAFAKKLQKELLPGFLTHTVEPALRRWREYLYPRIAQFTLRAVREFEDERLAEATMTFNDLLLRTRDLLRDRPEIRRYFQNRYRHLFVDEFQDTDPIQAEILFYLTGRELEEKDWKKLTPKPGRLFLVGDEKQSIYRFRRADVEIFRFVTKRIVETGGGLVHLNTSFRSYGRLCQWLNTGFKKLFEQENPEVQAEFGPLERNRPAGLDDRCVRKLVNGKVPGNRAAMIAAQDAERIAEFIGAAVVGKTVLNSHEGKAGADDGAILPKQASPGDFMILLRKKAYLPMYARALEDRGIPYDVTGAGTLNQSEELRALVQLLEAVFEPDNPVALAAFLRGTLSGISDADFYEYRRARGRFNYWSDPPAELPDDAAHLFGEAFGFLRDTAQMSRTLSPAATIEKLIEQTGLAGFGSIEEGGSSRAANLLKVVSLVRRSERNGLTWSEILNDLRFLLNDLSEEEEMTLETGQSNVVRLMNLHVAKGLEAPVVFLAYDTTPSHPPDFHFSRVEGEYLVAPAVAKKGRTETVLAEPVQWAEKYEPKERAFLEAEELRLLYVAATRARNLLVVSQYEPDPTKSAWSALNPFLVNVPPLKIPTAPVPVKEPVELDAESLIEERTRRFQHVKQASYQSMTVTGVKEEESFRAGKGKGFGAEFGTVVHRLFETAVEGRLKNEKETVRALLRTEGVDLKMEERALAVLAEFKGSGIWKELSDAGQVMTEVPFGHLIDGTITTGTIDLVFGSKNGWTIVDYKTDRLENEEELERALEHYRPQLQAYGRAFESITGEPVEKMGFWFTDQTRFVEIERA